MINVAVLGHGTVGSGVVELISMNHDHVAQKLEQELNVKYVLDIRDFPQSPYKEKFVKDFSIIENDPEIKVVAEVIGGINPAYDFTVRAIKAGKSVVTSNKELVAAKGCELLKLAKQYNVNYFFEASVGGGIPIIRPMHRCMAANEITDVYGILNGTTNFILTKMFSEGTSFEEALKLAQSLGYAEADPSADILGKDACRKICILASLAFGNHVYPEKVHTEGITEITLDDVTTAQENGYAIKLIGQAKRIGEKAKILVAPALIKNESLLSQVTDVFNAVMLTGNAVGDIFLCGRGAGKLPTASAVVADIVDAAKHFEYLKGWGWQDEKANEVLPISETQTRYFVRINGTPEDAEKIYENAEILKYEAGKTAFITNVYTENEHEQKFAALNVISKIRMLDL